MKRDAEAKRQGYELSASRVEEALAAPEGVIDPVLKMLTLFNGEKPVVSLSYYATHPQSYFGKGDVTSEFVGLARAQHEQTNDGLRLVHFNGAGGNVAAGKYNDGSPANRAVLASRLAAGMSAGWSATQRAPISASDVEWRSVEVKLPLRDTFANESQFAALLANSAAPVRDRVRAAIDIAWIRRASAGRPIQLSCLRLGTAHILHMPGELFVEYQLAAPCAEGQILVPSFDGTCPGTSVGRPLRSIPLAQVRFFTNGVAERNVPSVRSST